MDSVSATYERGQPGTLAALEGSGVATATPQSTPSAFGVDGVVIHCP
jgi:hypothetical protein